MREEALRQAKGAFTTNKEESRWALAYRQKLRDKLLGAVYPFVYLT